MLVLGLWGRGGGSSGGGGERGERQGGVEERGATCWLAWRDGSLVAALGLTAAL